MNTLPSMLRRNGQQGTAATGGTQMMVGPPAMQQSAPQQGSMGPSYQNAMSNGIDAYQLAQRLRAGKGAGLGATGMSGSQIGGLASSVGPEAVKMLAGAGGAGAGSAGAGGAGMLAGAGPWGAAAAGLYALHESGALEKGWDKVKDLFKF